MQDAIYLLLINNFYHKPLKLIMCFHFNNFIFAINFRHVILYS